MGVTALSPVSLAVALLICSWLVVVGAGGFILALGTVVLLAVAG